MKWKKLKKQKKARKSTFIDVIHRLNELGLEAEAHDSKHGQFDMGLIEESEGDVYLYFDLRCNHSYVWFVTNHLQDIDGWTLTDCPLFLEDNGTEWKKVQMGEAALVAMAKDILMSAHESGTQVVEDFH